MTPFEWVALAYFGWCALSGRLKPLPTAGALAAAAVVIVARFVLPWEARAWLAHAYLVVGYWLPAVFAPAINPAFEAWLCHTDRRLAGRWTLGGGNSHALELAYLLCYPLVPAAFVVVLTLGSRADVTRFWVAVLLAGYACYGTLRWTAARPPRVIARDGLSRRGVARLNATVLGRVSHNFNTFPSGHVAVSLAAALVVLSLSAPWGLAFLAVALAIAIAAVAGRYHYLVDVLAGVVVGLAAVTAAVAGFPAPGSSGG